MIVNESPGLKVLLFSSSIMVRVKEPSMETLISKLGVPELVLEEEGMMVSWGGDSSVKPNPIPSIVFCSKKKYNLPSQKNKRARER